MKWIRDEILKVLDQFAYPMFLVKVNPQLDCPCVTSPGGDADPGCVLCLGTGKKITIRKIKGLSQNSKAVFRTAQNNVKNESSNMPFFYVLPKYPVAIDDMFVENDSIFIATRVDPKKCEKGNVAYYYCETAPKKAHQAKILANFRSLIGE
jgi:hypothetical protein